MFNADGETLNDILTIEIENSALDETKTLSEQKFDPKGFGSVEFKQLWGQRELEIYFQHLENGFMNLSVSWGGELKARIASKTSNTEGISFTCSLGANEQLFIRSMPQA